MANLVPDTSTIERRLNASVSAATAVTNYAQASVTAVPVIHDPPSWYGPCQADLDTAQTHAKYWLETLCPATTSGIPKAIESYGTVFQTEATTILSAIATIEKQKGLKPTPEQRKEVLGGLGTLLAALQKQHAAVAGWQGDLKTYTSDVQSDHDRLAQDVSMAAEKFVEGEKWIQEIQASLSEGFLDSQVLGPCNAIVTIKLDVSIKVTESGANPALFVLLYAKAILTNQADNVGQEGAALGDVLDSWQTLLAKLEAVTQDVKDADDGDLLAVVQQAQLDTARNQWKELSAFAAKLRGTSPAVHDQQELKKENEDA